MLPGAERRGESCASGRAGTATGNEIDHCHMHMNRHRHSHSHSHSHRQNIPTAASEAAQVSAATEGEERERILRAFFGDRFGEVLNLRLSDGKHNSKGESRMSATPVSETYPTCFGDVETERSLGFGLPGSRTCYATH